MTVRQLALVAGAALWLGAGPGSTARAGAQASPRLRAEARLDAIVSRASTVQMGAGAIVPAGTYARIALVAAGGVTRAGGDSRASGRADLVVRFLLDPMAQSRWGTSLGGGLGYLDEGAGRRRGVMLLVLGLEGPRSRRGFRTAVEAGLGGGLRIGVVLRQARADKR